MTTPFFYMTKKYRCGSYQKGGKMFSADLHFYCSVIGSVCNKGSTRVNLLNQLRKITSLTIDEANQIIDVLIGKNKLVESNNTLFVRS